MRYLGVDFGLKRIGLAISDGELASPLKVLFVSSLDDSIQKIKQEVSKNKIQKIVIGMPEGQTGKLVKKFIDRLRFEKLEVMETDETLSTQNAKKLLLDLGLKRKNRRIDDSQAAAEILQNYLDEIR